MVSVRNIVLLLGFSALAAAQTCQNYWKGTAPFCSPTDTCRSTHRYNDIRDTRGDGAPCLTGKKKLCECLTPGGNPACTPTLPPKTYTVMKGWITLCDNKCKVYICGVKKFLFWKKGKRDARGAIRGLHARRLPPCESTPEQPHCQQPEPEEPPAVPTKEISSTPLTSADVLGYFQRTDIGALMQMVAALGQEDTAAMSREQLVEKAYGEFTATMAELEIEKVDASDSLAGFEQGPAGWRYRDGRSDEVA